MTSFSIWTRLLVSLALGIAAVPAAGQDDSPEVERYLAAADIFDRLAAQGAPPRRTDPEFAPAFGTLTDAEGILRSRHYGAEDIAELERIILRGTGVMMHYLDYASQENGVARAPATTERLALGYQGEIVGLSVFTLEAASVTVDTLNEFLRREGSAGLEPERREAGLQARRGLEQTVSAFIQMAGASGITPEHRLALLTAIGRNASTVASGLSLSQRRTVALLARTTKRGQGPQAQAQLDRLIAALSGPCTGLCAL